MCSYEITLIKNPNHPNYPAQLVTKHAPIPGVEARGEYKVLLLPIDCRSFFFQLIIVSSSSEIQSSLSLCPKNILK